MKHIIIGAFLGIVAGYFTPYFDTFNFPFGFMFIGIGFGITFLKNITGNENLFGKLFWIYIFIISGLAYSGMLNLRYGTSMGISEVRYFMVLLPVAVSVFVFIFCISLLSLQAMFRRFIYLLAAVITLSGLCTFLLDYLWLPSFIASFLVLATMFAITMTHFFKEKIKNLGLNIFVLFIVYTVGIISLPLTPYLHSLGILLAIVLSIGLVALLISLFGNVLYLIDRQSGKFQGKISLSWLASFSALICNYTIFLSIVCILVYRRTAEFLVKQGQLTKVDIRIAIRLSLTTLVIHLIYIFSYETFLRNIWTGDWTSLQHIQNVIVWGLCAALAAHSLGIAITGRRRDD
jgi:hypothetical protein